VDGDYHVQDPGRCLVRGGVLESGKVQCRHWACFRLGSSYERYPGTVRRKRWVPSHLSNPRADANPGGPWVCRLRAHEVNGDCLRTVWTTATRSPVDGGCVRTAWSTATRPPARVQISCRRTARSLEIRCTRECQQTGGIDGYGTHPDNSSGEGQPGGMTRMPHRDRFDSVAIEHAQVLP
jgi:hypothetical protein